MCIYIIVYFYIVYIAMNMPDGSTLNYNDSKKKMRNSLSINRGTDKALACRSRLLSILLTA